MKLERLINSGIPILCGVLLILIVSLTFLQIVFRQCFNFTMNWSDEVSQFCVSWLALLGLIWASQNNQHINTGIKLHKKLNERLIRLIDSILALMISGSAVVVAYQSALFAFTAMNISSLSLGWLKMGYVFSALPLAMLAVCYYYLKSIFKNVWFIFKKD